MSVGDLTVTSNAPASDVVASLTTEGSPEPKVLVENSQPVPEKSEEEERVSKAASELGKKGGEAAAKAKAEKAKIAKAEAAKEPEPKVEAKPEETPEQKEAAEEKKRSKERVEQATRQAAELKRQLASERQEREKLAQRLAEIEQRTAKPAESQKPTATDDPEPQEGQFENYSDYIKAAARWNARNEFSQRMETTKREAQTRYLAQTYAERVSKTVETFHDRMTKAAEADPLFTERTNGVAVQLRPSFELEPGERPGPLNTVADEIMSSEVGPQILDYFSKNESEFQRIAALRSAREVTREMAKIEARLDGATAGTPPTDERPVSKPELSRATPPVQPVTGKPHIAEDSRHTPDRASRQSLDDYKIGWKPAKTQR